eukprot:TRINITY_DN14246_c0_g1_i10.p1 TRINITY_DN14246_c0_g1~~TRINITY_DN14246_c0_g1_i10.p1  ORF type:complete len:146 (-),score=18.99 TRINITY_DN14246_c0_g1_i10:42-479(-)
MGDGHDESTLPELQDGLTYTQAAAGAHHTVLTRSDGSAVACGDNRSGQCNLPELEDGLTYTTQVACRRVVLQALFDGSCVQLASVAGGEVCRVEASADCRLSDLQAQLAPMLGSRFPWADIILPRGYLLRQALRQDPLAVLRDLS